MSARLTKAIKIGEAARAILQKTRSFPPPEFNELNETNQRENVGVEPMLLALAMELILKAWFVFDHDNPQLPRTHDLLKLFDKLKPESREKIDAEFKASVVPHHPNGFYIEYGIRDLLYQHKDAFVDWRYLHEAKKSMSFDQSAFEATLEMLLRQFRMRYRIEPARPHLRP